VINCTGVKFIQLQCAWLLWRPCSPKVPFRTRGRAQLSPWQHSDTGQQQNCTARNRGSSTEIYATPSPRQRD